MQNNTISWSVGNTNGIEIACQGFFMGTDLFGGIIRSVSSPVLFDVGLFLLLFRCTRFLLKPLRMPYAAQLLAGLIVGPILQIYKAKYSTNPQELSSIIAILAHTGFYLHLFMVGLELDLRKLTKIGKKSYIISLSGFFTSLAFGVLGYLSVSRTLGKSFSAQLMIPSFLFNPANYLLSMASHVNDLSISNSKIGQLALSASMLIDMTVMILAQVGNIGVSLVGGGKKALQGLLIIYFASLFFVFQPFIVYVVNLKPERKPSKQMHFVLIIVPILILAFLAETLDQKFTPFLVALTLPEEPLATILAERLDPFATNVLFPFYLLSMGMNLEFSPLNDIGYCILIILIVGYIGKFVGTMISAWFLRLTFKEALTLSLLMSAKGVFDFSALYTMSQRQLVTLNQYTVDMLDSTMTILLLPLTKLLYEPSRQYSTIMRHSILDFGEQNDTFLILVCIHKEESLQGLMSLLKVCHSTSKNKIAVIALQLLQLTGRCTMPIMAPLHEISSISALRSNIDRCTRVVNSFLYLERKTEGIVRAQHFVAMSPYTTMHNDVCNLAYEKTVGLVIIPFHVTWESVGTIKESSLSIREVNNMVLKKAPCSVGILIDRSNHTERVGHDNMYVILIVFLGGADDYEALAYSRLFANNPSVKLCVIWLKAPISEEKNEVDYEVMKQFQHTCKDNERISFKEVIVTNGAQTVETIVSMKNEVDLVVTGKYHNLMIIPMLGLSDGWCEYPELGVLGDTFASSDFEFSVLIVQQEPQTEFTLDFEES